MYVAQVLWNSNNYALDFASIYILVWNFIFDKTVETCQGLQVSKNIPRLRKAFCLGQY